MKMALDLNALEALAQRFKVLAEPTRLRILAVICDRECSVQEICDRTGLNQGNVSKHLRLMKDSGVVACRRAGIWRYYRVIDPTLLELCIHVHQARNSASSDLQPIPGGEF